jgi:FcoT-like thioesterase domain
MTGCQTLSRGGPGLLLPQRPPPEFGHDQDLLDEVLRVYRPDCRYLRSATVSEAEPGLATGRCEFSIPAPFYIDDTGHFNAVEFNLCYNQMLYYTSAKCVKEGLMPPFAHWTLDEFRTRQLPDFLIVDFRSSFRRGIRPDHFYGEIAFTGVREFEGGGRWQMIIADTTCRYWDDHGGRSRGEVRLVVTNPPGAAP